MAAVQLHGEGNLWFFTRRPSPKIAEAKLDQQVNLCYPRAGKQDFLSVSRTAEPLLDKGKMQTLWSPPENSPLLLQLFPFSL
jgi:general stress protein 26